MTKFNEIVETILEANTTDFKFTKNVERDLVNHLTKRKNQLFYFAKMLNGPVMKKYLEEKMGAKDANKFLNNFQKFADDTVATIESITEK